MSRFELRASVLILVCALALAAAPHPAVAGPDVPFDAAVQLDDDKSLFAAIATRHYERDPALFAGWEQAFSKPDDLNVALHIARHCDRGPEYFAQMRKSGAAWFEIANRCRVPVEVWFVPVARDPGPPYGKAYGHWKKRQSNPRETILLTDREVRDLAAVRFAHEYYGVPVETAMEWRRDGRDVRKIMVSEYRQRHGRHAAHDDRGRGRVEDEGRSKDKGRGRDKDKGR